MWPFLKHVWYKAIHDEQAFVGWVRGTILGGAVTIALYIHDIEVAFGAVWGLRAKALAAVLGIAAGMIRAGEKNPATGQANLQP